MIEFNMKRFLADRRTKEKYVCDRIPDEGMRIVLYEGSASEPPVIADLMVERWEGNADLVIESNEPEIVDLDEVYRYFRRGEMTFEESWREMVFVDPVKDYRRKVSMLSATQRELLGAASELQRLPARTIAEKAGHEPDGHVKSCLRVLTMLGLLDSNWHGYIKIRPPRHPYHG